MTKTPMCVVLPIATQPLCGGVVYCFAIIAKNIAIIAN
jgi:hypothetical protein